MITTKTNSVLLCALLCWNTSNALAAETDPRADALQASVWRDEQRIVDVHTHIEAQPERFERAARIFQAVGVGTAMELGSGTLTSQEGATSAFEQKKAVGEQTCPDLFMYDMLLDYSGFENDDWSQRAVEQVNKAYAAGAAGLKEFKRLGLTVRDGNGKLVRIDDPKLDAVWKRCGELQMPVSIHVGDPKAFWEPYDETNERWEELRDHPGWWFGDPDKYPSREEVLEQFLHIIERHPQTTFIGVHFGNNPEDIDWVSRHLDKYPNYMCDIAARIPEIGRSNPEKLRQMFVKHQDRILFGTDFMVYGRMILGSAGDDERPTDQDAVIFYRKCYRFFETDDRNWKHMTPIQGSWTIDSINIPAAVQRKVYFDNAQRMFASSMPPRTLKAVRIEDDFELDGHLNDQAWDDVPIERLEYTLKNVSVRTDLSTSVRALWSDNYLYLGYEAPYSKLTTAETPANEERHGLWNDDVVELFLAPDPEHPEIYQEYEWAPNGEQLDLSVSPSEKRLEWSSDMESRVTVDEEAHIFRVEARIPIASITSDPPSVGTRWRANLYRNDVANGVFLAWHPTLQSTAHVPERFGWLELIRAE
ncbi:amidohydrolase family protein [Aeoliella mucimassa]|uniref:Amidohydrolase n=1 Tax=Aeoliella mucimassa TaxID=2527972 RepID=A0A518APK5_9BACT|nr:amidohydrolase family protein [Aeoliella mucimassa]QDU56657.1 Amidohydrolase [Aeoliella mucimassa]